MPCRQQPEKLLLLPPLAVARCGHLKQHGVPQQQDRARIIFTIVLQEQCNNSSGFTGRTRIGSCPAPRHGRNAYPEMTPQWLQTTRQDYLESLVRVAKVCK